MAAPPGKKLCNAALEETETRVSTQVLVHVKKLLRLKNRYCSPLLRLPVEVIIHILSFVMGKMGYSYAWKPIFKTCHQIWRIMCETSSLWWRVDASLRRNAQVILMRSNGAPREVVARLLPWDEWDNVGRVDVLRYWRDRWVLQGHRLRKLDFLALPYVLPIFTWIFKQSLPRLRHLRLHVVSGLSDPLEGPVAIRLPTNTSLRTLDLCNVTLPWSSSIFTGLLELHLDFRSVFVSITGEELFRILGASPQLERLSLVQLEVRRPISTANSKQFALPIIRLPALNFLKVYNDPQTVGYILAQMDISSLVSLQIFPVAPRTEVVQWINRFFSGTHLSKELLSSPPVLEVAKQYDISSSLEFTIGSLKIQFPLDVDNIHAIHAAAATCVPLTPSSVASLNLESTKLDQREWKDFFSSHPEVLSVEFIQLTTEPVLDSFFDALSPGDGGVVLCPRLESIVLRSTTTEWLEPLRICLDQREGAGSKLKRLKITGLDACRFTSQLRPLVEVLEAEFSNVYKQKVSLSSMDAQSISD